MYQRPLILTLQFLCLACCSLHAADAPLVKLGDDYEAVVETLGKPDGDLSAGSKRILAYGEAKVVLRAGKVSEISSGLENKLELRKKDQALLTEKRQAGLVNYKGEWMQPEKVDALIHAEAETVLKNRSKASAQAHSGGWHTNYQQALSLAKSQNKKLLINFTGSDWCGWCIKLDKEVFSQSRFIEYAKGHYILLKCDFPKRSSLPKQLQNQNDQLAKKYGVRGFPTVIVLTPNGKIHRKSGYVRGGPSAFLNSLR
jgi:thioredoxin-related protein